VDLALAVEFLAAHGGTFPFAALVGASFPLAEAEAAFAHAHAHLGERVAVLP
jgi:hypothetical protein